MKLKAMVVVVVLILVTVVGVVIKSNWGGSPAEEAAEEMRDEFTGKRVINQGEQLKGQLGAIGVQKKSEADSLFP